MRPRSSSSTLSWSSVNPSTYTEPAQTPSTDTNSAASPSVDIDAATMRQAPATNTDAANTRALGRRFWKIDRSTTPRATPRPRAKMKKPKPSVPASRMSSENTGPRGTSMRSEEHTSELQSLMRISYAVFCLKKQKQENEHNRHTYKTQS